MNDKKDTFSIRTILFRILEFFILISKTQKLIFNLFYSFLKFSGS